MHTTNLSMSPLASSSRHTRFRPALWALVAALAAASALVAATPGSARAASLPKNLAKFAHCPVDVKKVKLCLFSSTTSTTFQIGSTVVSSTSPRRSRWASNSDKSGEPIVVLPDDGTQALQSPAIPLPGGLLGIPGAPDGGPLQVTVTPQIVGIPTLSLANLLTGSGPGLDAADRRPREHTSRIARP